MAGKFLGALVVMAIAAPLRILMFAVKRIHEKKLLPCQEKKLLCDIQNKEKQKSAFFYENRERMSELRKEGRLPDEQDKSFYDNIQ